MGVAVGGAGNGEQKHGAGLMGVCGRCEEGKKKTLGGELNESLFYLL